MGAKPTTRISLYERVQQKQGTDIELDTFIERIRTGQWQDIVLSVRVAKSKEEKEALKKTLPAVTISGFFATERKAGSVTTHSGFISLDFDNLNDQVESYRALLRDDPYVYSVFTSCSGRGLCAIVPVDPAKHSEAFAGLTEYMHEKYRMVVDPSGKDVSRARFVSYDPDCTHNPAALRFKLYPKKEKERKPPRTVYVQDDFDQMISLLAPKNICESYSDWRSVGYALIDKFGEGGRHYFHALSSTASSYDPSVCDRQYSAFLKNNSGGKDKYASISTIFYYAKLHGVPMYSEKTNRILSSTSVLHKSGLTAGGIVSNLQKFEDIAPEESQDIVEQALQNGVTVETDESTITLVENWLRYNHSVRRNMVSRRLENNGRVMKDSDINTMFLSCKKAFDDINFDLFTRILLSDATPEFNPLLEFFQSYQHREPTGTIDRYFNAFKVKEGLLKHFGEKWLVGLISAAHGKHSPLVLVFTGAGNTGKTEVFRRMFPKELQPYYAESKLDAGKDDEILMCEKLLIMDDEMGGKSKRDSQRLKELTSKQVFSLRVPYGRGNEDIQRLAVLCGTSNETSLLNDPTGNRRIIPIEVTGIDFDKINAVDRIDLLMEAYHLWKAGYKWELSSIDISMLSTASESFEQYSIEYELLQRYMTFPADSDPAMEWSSTEIKVFLEKQSMQKIIQQKLGQELKRMGVERRPKKVNGKTVWVYRVLTFTGENSAVSTPLGPQEEAPF